MADQPGEHRRLLDYASPERRKPGKIFRVTFVLLGIMATMLFGLALMIPSANTVGTPLRAKCASNLRQIGQAILLYNNDYQGAYPDTLGKLLETEDITPDVFVCPASSDTAAAGPTTKAIVANLTAGGHLTYIYVGAGMNQRTVPANAVVAYEPTTNHGSGGGSNVLFGDGHVEFEDNTAMAHVYSEVAAKRLPVTLP